MEISTVQHQVMSSNQLIMEEAMLAGGSFPKSDHNQEKKPRPQPDQALKCPRCESTNTKFCYYNNYSLSQPRYFCKACRRYWTQGGSLRNVPVGGSCRKNHKRSSSNPSNNSKKPLEFQTQTPNPNNLPTLSYDPSNNLTLAPFLLGSNPNPNIDFLDILRGGFLDSANQNGFNNLCSYGFDGGLGLSCPTSTATATATAALETVVDEEESKVMMGHQWQFSTNNVAVDSAARDYWNGAGGYNNWNGIINSSLM